MHQAQLSIAMIAPAMVATAQSNPITAESL